MYRHISIGNLSVALCLLFFVTASANYGFAQGAAAQPQLVLIYDIQAKAGMAAEFENVVRNDLIPELKKLGDTAVFTWRTEFGQADRYIFATPIKSMAELDAPDPLLATLGQKGMAYLGMRMGACSYSPRIFMVSTRPDLSSAIPQNYQPKLATMVTVSIAPGRAEEFEKNAKIMQGILQKTTAKGYLVTQVGAGGNMDEYISFLMFDSFSDMGKFQAAIQKMITEANMISPAGFVMSRKTDVLRFVPEMSHTPAPQQAAN